jgi:membrane protein DedA with SNARE-associated domain
MLHWITHTMNALGYVGVLWLMLLENLLPFIPSEIIMPLAGYSAVQGKMSIFFVVASGTVGSVLGNLPIYFVCRAIGRQRLKNWASRHGRWLMLSGEHVDRAKEWFDRHGKKAVFICRMVPGIRPLISIPAGFYKMRFGLYLAYTTFGTFIWVTVLALLGFVLGENFLLVQHYLGPVAFAVLGVLAAAIVYWVLKHRKGHTPGDDSLSGR